MVFWILLSLVVTLSIILAVKGDEGFLEKICKFFFGLIMLSIVTGLIYLFSFVLICGNIFIEKEFKKESDNFALSSTFQNEEVFSVGIGKIDNMTYYILLIKNGENRDTYRQFVIKADECVLVLDDDQEPKITRDRNYDVKPEWIMGPFYNPDGEKWTLDKWKLTIPKNTVFKNFDLQGRI